VKQELKGGKKCVEALWAVKEISAKWLEKGGEGEKEKEKKIRLKVRVGYGV